MSQPDLFTRAMRATPHFRGKDRLILAWISRQSGQRRIRRLGSGITLELDLSVPYEATVWLAGRQPELELLGSLVRPGDTFVDCGANIGLWTLFAGLAAGASGTVHCFEPHPAVFRKLSRNVELSRLPAHVQLHQKAVGEKPGALPFRVEAMHDMSRIVRAEGDATTTVEVTTLDAALGDGPVHGIKLDVEGFEAEALEGAQAVLRRWRPWLCLELNPSLAGVDTLGEWEPHRRLRELGYVPRLLADALNTSRTALLADGWRTSLGHCDLFYSPE